jgi:predicted nucleic acid-binding protein
MGAPDPIPAVDGLIAATAKVHGMTLVTCDTRRLAQYGVTLFNPLELIH